MLCPHVMSDIILDFEEPIPAKGLESYFLVTRAGRVFSVRKGKWLKGSKLPRGYRYFNTTVEGQLRTITIHRLVADTFIPNDDPSLEVCHRDNDPGNNSVENLYWGTHSENMEQAARDGRLRVAKISISEVRLIKARRASGEKLASIARDVGLSVSHVSNICLGRSWSHAA